MWPRRTNTRGESYSLDESGFKIDLGILGGKGEGWGTGKIPLKDGVWEPVDGLKLNCDIDNTPETNDFAFEHDNKLDIPRIESDKTVKSSPLRLGDRLTTIEIRSSNKSHSNKSSSKSEPVSKKGKKTKTNDENSGDKFASIV